MATGSRRAGWMNGDSGEQGWWGGEDEEGWERREAAEGRARTDLTPFLWWHIALYCTQEKAGAFCSCTIAVPSFSKHLAISARKGAWGSLRLRDTAREEAGRTRLTRRTILKGAGNGTVPFHIVHRVCLLTP